jgi:hypothetical protein
MKIGFFGCSFTEGGGLDSFEWNTYALKHNLIDEKWNIRTTHPNLEIDLKDLTMERGILYKQYRDEHKFSTLIGKKLKCQVDNLALSCNSNENIFDVLYENLYNYDKLVVQLTLKTRVLWWFELMEKFYNLNSYEYQNTPFNNEPKMVKLADMYKEYLELIYNEEQAQKKIAQYVDLFSNMRKEIYWITWEHCETIVDVPNLIKFESKASPHSLGNWASHNKQTFEHLTNGEYMDSHLTPEAHEIVADRIIEVISEK